jgi:hypothetical protein
LAIASSGARRAPGFVLEANTLPMAT